MKTLNEITQYLNSIDFINQGGCAISTLAIYRWCKNNNIDVKMIYGYVKDHEKYYYNNTLSNLNTSHIVPPSHSFIFDGWNYFDCSESLNIAETKEIFSYMHEVDEQFIIASINEPYWNDAFDRKNIHKIEQKLGIDLSDIIINIDHKKVAA